MKIVYISCVQLPSRYASSVHIVNMVEQFAALGHSTVLFNPNIQSKYNAKKLAKYYGVLPNFQLLRFWIIRAQARIRYLRRFKRFTYGLYLRFLNPDLVYIRDQAIYEFSSLVASLGKPFILEAHLPNKTAELGLLLGHKNLVKFVVISIALKNEYLRLYPSIADKIEVHHDAASHNSKASLMLKDKQVKKEDPSAKIFTGAYIGNLYPGKCMEELVSFAERLEGQVRFMIYGGQEDDIKYWRSSLEKNSIPNISLCGYLAPTDLLDSLTEVDFFIAPFSKEVTVSGYNLTPWMSPLKIFEYMALNKPIVCTDLPVIREILENGYNALLCEPGNPLSWISSILYLKNNQSHCKRLAKQALEDFENQYTWNKRALSILSGI
jgi:glycosyltransferase involved in cell wall biosynthesis